MGDRAWKMRKFTDAEIVVAGERIPVHRATLCATSPVFDAGFSCDMQEGRSGVYKIMDASAVAVESMLRFIYTGRLECSPQELTSLLELGHHYELPNLCEVVARNLLDD